MFVFLDAEPDVEQDADPIDEPERRHVRKQLTYQRKVNSIDAALDEANYNAVEISLVARRVVGKLPAPTNDNKKNKENIYFSNRPAIVTGRQGIQDIIRIIPGVSAIGRTAKTSMEVFSLFLTDEMLTEIVLETNKQL